MMTIYISKNATGHIYSEGYSLIEQPDFIEVEIDESKLPNIYFEDGKVIYKNYEMPKIEPSDTEKLQKANAQMMLNQAQTNSELASQKKTSATLLLEIAKLKGGN